MTERRHRRSGNPFEALRLLLESQRRRLGASALAVVTRDGKMIAGVGKTPEKLERAEERAHAATWELRAAGLELVVASQGRRLSYEVGAGVRRILGG